MKKVISLSLIVLLMQMFFVRPSFANTKDEVIAEKVKTEIVKFGIGQDAKVKIKLKDGTKIKGYIAEANENQFVVMDSKTSQPIPVSYSQVKQAKGNNLSTGVKIAIGVAVFFGVIILAAYFLKT